MFSSIFIPIFLFGVLVFIHELGHFTVAKLCGVFVERFSIGFGPAILKKKFGETEYALCAFPLGGYVKMRGEELPETEEEKNQPQDPRSFAVQNVWKRIAIVIMGPTSNFILPIVLFTILFLIGLPVPSSDIGSVLHGSPAEQAGLLPGDKILEIQHQEVHAWTNLTKRIQNRANQETELLVERSGKIFPVNITPKLEDDKNEYGENIQAGKIGIDFVAYKPIIGISDSKSKAYIAGLRTGDIIKSVNDKPVTYWWQLESIFSQNKAAKKMTVERTGADNLTVSISPNVSLSQAGIEKGELFINKVMDKSVASEKGLQKGDKIDSVNGTKLAGWTEFRENILKNRGENITLGLVRDGKPISVEIAPNEVVQKNEVTFEKKKVRQLGVVSESINYPINYYSEQYTNVFVAFGKGISETLHLTKQTFIGLGKLVSGKLSVNTLGGPISIFYMAGTSYESGGWNSFFHLMAVLSITLAVMNILPMPVLDGGHLFFFLIEAVKGSPIRLRIRQMATQVGFYLLMGLMVLVFYVDINRFFVDKIKALFN